MNGVRRYVNHIREKLRIKAMFNAAIDVPLPIRPECAMIGDAMLCTHLQDVSLLRLCAASSRIVSWQLEMH